MTDKILIDRELLERIQAVLSRWSGIINYQYTGSREAMTYLQTADDVSQPVLNEISAALDAPQQPEHPGCDHCNHPMFAAMRCDVCGKVHSTDEEPHTSYDTKTQEEL